MYRPRFRTALLAALAIACVAAADAGAVNHGLRDKKGFIEKRLSPTQYLTLHPFTIPVVDKGRHDRNFIIIVAIELVEEDDREELVRLSARMRDEMYRVLFQTITFRTAKPRIPSNEVLRQKLHAAAVKTVGEELVKSLVVHKTHLGNKP